MNKVLFTIFVYSEVLTPAENVRALAINKVLTKYKRRFVNVFHDCREG